MQHENLDLYTRQMIYVDQYVMKDLSIVDNDFLEIKKDINDLIFK
jgi:hypothetical protein